MKKRLVKLALVVCLVVTALSLSVVACSQPATAPSAPSPGAKPAGTTAPAAAPAQVYKWRLQCSWAVGWPWEVVPQRFVQRVKQMSGGRIDITTYPAGALFSSTDTLKAIGSGAIEIGYGSVTWSESPSALITWGVPQTLRESIEEYSHMWWDLGMGDVAQEAYAKQKTYLLSPIWITPYGGTMSKKPINTLADIKGIKLRSYSIFGDLWKAFGAAIVYVLPAEMYTAMATGTIDAAHFSGPDEFYGLKLHEVAKYFLTGPVAGHCQNSLSMNLDIWKSLPPDLQLILVMAARIAGEEAASHAHYYNYISTGKMKAAGVKFYSLSDADLATMQKKTFELCEEAAKKDPLAAKALEILRKAMVVYETEMK